jgi:hypothetical protein
MGGHFMTIGYAIKNDLSGWRAVSSEQDVVDGEHFSVVPTEIKPSFSVALAALNTTYVKDRDELCAAWLRAAVADGVDESSRKEDVEMELAELDANHAADVAALKSEYGVA